MPAGCRVWAPLLLVLLLFGGGGLRSAEEQKSRDVDLNGLTLELKTTFSSLSDKFLIEKLVGRLPALGADKLPALLQQAASIEDANLRTVAQCAVIEKLAESDPGAATKAGVKLLAEAGSDYERASQISWSMRKTAEKWARKSPKEALEWSRVEVTNSVKESTMQQELSARIVAAALATDRAIAAEDLQRLPDATKGTALSFYAADIKDDAARTFFLQQVAKLPADAQRHPLSAYASSLYQAGKKDAVSKLIKENCHDDVARAFVALQAPTADARDDMEKIATKDLPWVRAHAPATLMGATVGRFFANLSFGDAERAAALLRKNVKPEERDAAYHVFCTTEIVAMGGSDAGFALAQEIGDPELRLQALKAVVQEWSSFRAVEAIEKAKGLSPDEVAALREIVDSH